MNYFKGLAFLASCIMAVYLFGLQIMGLFVYIAFIAGIYLFVKNTFYQDKENQECIELETIPDYEPDTTASIFEKSEILATAQVSVANLQNKEERFYQDVIKKI